MADPTVHVIDDDFAIRHGLQLLIDSAGYESKCYESAESFIEAADSVHGCAIIDLRMPRIGGLELQRMMRGKLDNVGIIFISGHGNISAASRALRGGAVDFLTKPVDPETLLDRINETLTYHDAHENAQTDLEAIRERLDRLTDREYQVMNAVTAGGSNKQIARQLNISYRTVELHRARVMSKMDACSVADLVRQSVRIDEAG